jgi:hypothetical protein
VPLVIVGVMGPGEGATARDREDAYQLGRAIAQEGWSLVTGGRNEGVMDSASRGAKEAGGLTIGVLPSSDKNGVSRFVDVPIVPTTVLKSPTSPHGDVSVTCAVVANRGRRAPVAVVANRRVPRGDVEQFVSRQSSGLYPMIAMQAVGVRPRTAAHSPGRLGLPLARSEVVASLQ